MKKGARIVLMSGLMIAAFVTGIGLAGDKERRATTFPNEAAALEERDLSTLRILLDKRIEQVLTWYVGDTGDEPLLCIVKAFDKDSHYQGRGQKLTIYDKSGAILYEDYFTSVDKIYLTPALRKAESQLLMDVNEGGNSTNFLHMLDYVNGKIVEVRIEEDGAYNSSEPQVRPQFRRGVVPAQEPFQIMLTEGVGLASLAEKHTSVYRYKNGAYRYVGKYNQHDVDDYIEKLLSKGNVKRVR